MQWFASVCDKATSSNLKFKSAEVLASLQAWILYVSSRIRNYFV